MEAVKLEARSAPTIERAVELFSSDKRSQGLYTAVLKKYIRWGDSASSWRSGLGISLVRSASKISRSFAQRGELPTLLDDTGKGPGTPAGIPPLLLRVRTDRPHTKALTDQGGRGPEHFPLTEAQYTKLLKVVPAEFPTPKALRVRALIGG